ncbi:MAG: hypothetical protein M1469_04770 [Bacteroidetes bacterium]|nr:hypothetical protein [Bacteroidota bacterium]
MLFLLGLILNGFPGYDPYQAAFASWAGDMNGSLFFAIAYIFFWFLILLWMCKKKIFVKI